MFARDWVRCRAFRAGAARGSSHAHPSALPRKADTTKDGAEASLCDACGATHACRDEEKCWSSNARREPAPWGAVGGGTAAAAAAAASIYYGAERHAV